MSERIERSIGAEAHAFQTADGAPRQHIYIYLPSLFWHDHADRALPAGELVRESGRRVLVRVTPDELAEIRSDAAYYSDPSGGPDWEEGGPIRRSAAATVRAIDRAFSTDSERSR